MGGRIPSISPYGPFQVSDGAVFFGIQNERQWLVLCHDVLGRGGPAADPRFATNPDRWYDYQASIRSAGVKAAST